MNEQVEKTLKTKSIKRYEFAAASDIGNVREINQDVYAQHSGLNGDLFLVCDGMGGTELGKEAARLAADTIIETVSGRWTENVFELMKNSIKKANQAVYLYSKKMGKTAGTTVVIVLIRNSVLYYAHVGDSRLYYLGGGRFFPLTKDHSLVQSLLDEGLITKQEAAFHPKRNIISRSLGIEAEVEPEICKEALTPSAGDCLLMCSDGLTGEINDESIREILSENISVKEKVIRLTEAAKKYGGNDNITVLLIHFFEQIPRKTIDEVPLQKTEYKKHTQIKLLLFSIVLIVMTVAFFYFFRLENSHRKSGQKLDEKSYETVVISRQNFEFHNSDSVSAIINGVDDCFMLYSQVFGVSAAELMKANKTDRLFFKAGELIFIPKKEKHDR